MYNLKRTLVLVVVAAGVGAGVATVLLRAQAPVQRSSGPELYWPILVPTEVVRSRLEDPLGRPGEPEDITLAVQRDVINLANTWMARSPDGRLRITTINGLFELWIQLDPVDDAGAFKSKYPVLAERVVLEPGVNPAAEPAAGSDERTASIFIRRVFPR